jgi:hypothetical protein
VLSLLHHQMMLCPLLPPEAAMPHPLLGLQVIHPLQRALALLHPHPFQHPT